MTILLVQTFLLMLGAFLLGASLACLIRRGFMSESVVDARTANAGLETAAGSAAPVSPAETDRFGRALSGGQGLAVPPVFHPGQPVVEVQPRPASPPAAKPVVRAAPQPAPQSPPQSPAPPQRVVLPPAPAPVAQQPAPPPKPAEAAPAPPPAAPPQPSQEPSYTQVAIAAAAAAAAAAAKQKAEADALKTAEGADEGPSLFGTPAASSPLERGVAGEAVDDLTRIRGIDVDLKERLVRYGVHRFSQIAEWSSDDVRAVNQTLGFQGRLERESWVEQARILAEGGSPSDTPKAPPAAIEPAAVTGDRLHRIIGMDSKSEAVLVANGVTNLTQIAMWSAADVLRFEGVLGAPGRIRGESWVEQAVFLTGRAPPAPEPEPVSEAPAPVVKSAAAPAPPAPAPTQTAPAPSAPAATGAPRGESYAGLRSVKSEALRGDGFAGVAAGSIDDLKRIRGIGVLIEKKLNSMGITAYEQVANWTRGDIDRISQILDFKGRVERENWIEQARILASGGHTEFSRRVDRGDA